MPIRSGYFRLSNASDDVRRCPDAAENCEGKSECDLSSSGCSGGNSSSLCRGQLQGVYCRLCSQSNQYYVAAAGATTAHCAECGNTIGVTLGLAVSFVAGILLVLFIFARAKRKASYTTRKLVASFTKQFAPMSKLKILINFFMIASKVDSVYDVSLPADVRAVLRFSLQLFSLGIQGFTTTSLQCVGLSGYVSRLVFFMVFPPIAVLVILAAFWLGSNRSSVRAGFFHQTNKADPRVSSSTVPARSRTALIQRALPTILKVVFVLYPLVSTAAFEGFPCYEFEDGRGWLIADVAIECRTPDHNRATLLAWVAVIIYPVGLWLSNLMLLWRARDAIKGGKQTPLSRSIAFLFKEYEPEFYWWELAEMLRKFLLVGLFVVFEPGSITQIITGTIVCAVYLMIQLQARPYVNRSDDYLATASSFCLLMVFFCSVIYKYAALTDTQDLREKMSTEQKADYLVSSVTLSAVLLMSILGSIVFSGVLAVVQISATLKKQAQLRRLMFCTEELAVPVPYDFVRDSTALEHMVNSGLYKKSIDGGIAEEAWPLPTAGPFHVFLSHNWKHGQGVMRIVKDTIREMLPGASVFLGRLILMPSSNPTQRVISFLAPARTPCLIPCWQMWTILGVARTILTSTYQVLSSASVRLSGSLIVRACVKLCEQCSARSPS